MEFAKRVEKRVYEICQKAAQKYGGKVVFDWHSSEDFAWYLEKAPGMIFRFGTRNEKKGCTALAHRSDFCIDEKGMKAAIYAFAEYIMGAEPYPDIYLGWHQSDCEKHWKNSTD